MVLIDCNFIDEKRNFSGEAFNFGPKYLQKLQLMDLLKVCKIYWPNIKVELLSQK